MERREANGKRSERVSASSTAGELLAGGGSWWRGLEIAADGACVVTGEGRITLWNRAAARITGYETREVLGRRYAQTNGTGPAYAGPQCEGMAATRLGQRLRDKLKRERIE